MVTPADCARATVGGVIYDPTLRQQCQALYYASLDPAQRAYELSLDLSATALAQLRGPALPFKDVVVKPTAGFGFISFPGVGIAPEAAAILSGGGAPAMSVTTGFLPQQTLAEALIASGALTLGPEAFTTPEARASLATALSRSPVGGGFMSSPFMAFAPTPGAGFGLGGQFLGGTMPQGFLGGILTPEVGGSLIGTLGGLAGQFLQQQWAQKAAEDAAKAQRELLMQQAALWSMSAGAPAMGFAPAGPLLGQILTTMAVGAGGPLAAMLGEGLFGTGAGGSAAGCGNRGAVTVSPMDAAGIYSAGCSGPKTRARFFALRPDGTRDLFVRVGKVQSVSQRTLTRFARRWAKEAKLTVGARSSRRRGGRRRPR